MHSSMMALRSHLRNLRVLAAITSTLLIISTALVPSAALASCTAPCAYDTYVTGTANSGLVAYYPMYDTSGTTMTDTSGNNHNGLYSSSGLTLNGINGVDFDGSANSEAWTDTLNLTPANGGTVTVNLLFQDNEVTTCCSLHMLFNQTSNFGTTTGAIGYELRDNGAMGDGVNRMAAGQSYDGGGLHYNIEEQPRVGFTGWYMLTAEFRRDQKYGYGTPLNDCYSTLTSLNGTAQSPIVNQCWNMVGVNFVNGAFQLAAYGNHNGPSHVTLRGVGFWTRALTGTEISALANSAFN